jgi:hypothetical protein
LGTTKELEILFVLLHHVLDDCHGLLKLVEALLTFVSLHFNFVVGWSDQFKFYFPAINVYCSFGGQ